MEDNRILRFIYTLFLGVMLAIFVGVGINAFYAAPQVPQYPTASVPGSIASQQYAAQSKAYESSTQSYSRNVSIIALVAAVILVAASIAAEKRARVIADGIMLGGLLTLFYSVMRSFASADNKYMFLVVAVGLAVVIYLGYHRFGHAPRHGRA